MSFFKNMPTWYLLVCGVVLILVSKLIEISFETIALVIQLISFVLILWGLIRLFNKK